MKSVRLGDFIEYDGEAWKVYSELGEELVLRHAVTGKLRRVRVLKLLGDESFVPDLDLERVDLSGLAALERLGADQRADVEDLYRHVHQIINGTYPYPDESAPDPRYGTTVPMNDRVQAKADELGKSTRQMWRYVRAYREKGVAGLVDQRSLRVSSEYGRVDPRIVAIAEAEIKDATFGSTGSRGRAVLRISMQAEDEALPLPSDRTLYRLVNRLAARKLTFGEAATRRSLANQPDRHWEGVRPQVPGEIVEIDSSPLDVMVLLPNGEVGRPEVTGAIDVATRTVLATVITPVSTKGIDAGLVLARALTPPADQPGWDEALAWARDTLPDGLLPSVETYIEEWSKRPHIYPASITTDRGKAYQSDVFRHACEHFQISLINASSKTPTDKPHIERFFGSMCSMFAQHVKGYTGRSVSTRGRDPAAEALWTIDQVQSLLDWWLVSEYQQKPHSDLHHPSMPHRDLSPTQMFQTLGSVAPQPIVQFTREDFLQLLPTRLVTIQKDGITMNKLLYKSPELSPLVGRESGLGGRAGKKWVARYDPYRLRQIYLHNHRDGTWITCTWNVGAEVPEFSQETLQAALATLNNPRKVAGGDVLKAIIRIQTAVDLTKKQKRALARQHSTPHPAHEEEAPPDDGDDTTQEETAPKAKKRKKRKDKPPPRETRFEVLN